MDQSTKDVGFFLFLFFFNVNNERANNTAFISSHIQDPKCVMTLRCFIFYFQKQQRFRYCKEFKSKHIVSDTSKIIEILTYWVVFRKITLHFSQCNAIYPTANIWKLYLRVFICTLKCYCDKIHFL